MNAQSQEQIKTGRLLLLTRKSSNPTCTLGELTSDDGQLRLVTKEGKIPQDRLGYIMWCLPPGKYPLEIDYCCISYKDKPVHAYWPVLKKVPWFPKAGFYTGTIMSANKGCIKLGTTRVDDYQIAGDDEACQQLVRWAKNMYGTSELRNLENSKSRNLENSESQDPSKSQHENFEVTNFRVSEFPTMYLEIRQDEETMQFSNLTEQAFRLADQLAKEKAEQEALAQELGLSPTPDIPRE